MSGKAVDIPCKKCGNSLKDGRVMLALKDDVLGARIVVGCPKCQYTNRLTIKEERTEAKNGQ